MAIFQGGNVQLVKPGDKLHFDKPTNVSRIDKVKNVIRNRYSDAIPDACKSCSNHPSNGGSGICHCTLGTPQVKC